jgi:DNA-binding NtrC family response regulator
MVFWPSLSSKTGKSWVRVYQRDVKLPDLRERFEDIPLLTEHFLHKLNTKTGKMIEGLSNEARVALQLYDWPGNIRELENAMEHAFVMCRGGLIALEHLPEHIRASRKAAPRMGYKSLEDYERLAIINALIRNQWKRMATARELNIGKNTLRRKIQRYGISLP